MMSLSTGLDEPWTYTINQAARIQPRLITTYYRVTDVTATPACPVRGKERWLWSAFQFHVQSTAYRFPSRLTMPSAAWRAHLHISRDLIGQGTIAFLDTRSFKNFATQLCEFFLQCPQDDWQQKKQERTPEGRMQSPKCHVSPSLPCSTQVQKFTCLFASLLVRTCPIMAIRRLIRSTVESITHVMYTPVLRAVDGV